MIEGLKYKMSKNFDLKSYQSQNLSVKINIVRSVRN